MFRKYINFLFEYIEKIKALFCEIYKYFSLHVSIFILYVLACLSLFVGFIDDSNNFAIGNWDFAAFEFVLIASILLVSVIAVVLIFIELLIRNILKKRNILIRNMYPKNNFYNILWLFGIFCIFIGLICACILEMRNLFNEILYSILLQ